MEEPEEYARLWYQTAKNEVRHHPGELFNTDIYMKATLKDELAKHVTMWRAMVMATEVGVMCPSLRG